MSNLLIFLATIPGLCLIGYVYKMDKIEKEPTGLLVKLFLYGVISVIPAVILELVFSYFLGSTVPQNTLLFSIVENFLCVAFVEEYCKYFFLKIGSFKKSAFDYRFDGIVYAVVVSLGFAIFENIMYVLEGGVSLAILRAITSIPGHAIFGLYMGYYYGVAKQYEHDKKRKKAAFRKAVWIPVFLHGLYDFLASSSSDYLLLAFLAYIILLEITAFIKIRRDSKEDYKL